MAEEDEKCYPPEMDQYPAAHSRPFGHCGIFLHAPRSAAVFALALLSVQGSPVIQSMKYVGMPRRAHLVNNREYQTPTYHSTESSAKENAALIAFNICRNFSANDGMYPTGFAHGGVIQGNPVPVGSGRHSRRGGADTSRAEYRYGDSDSTGSRSGGSSPDWGESRLSSPMRMSPSRRVVYSSDASQYSRRAIPRY
ncbi:uncharacterized protein Z520_01408 [Fonsecaea multimorphosa CBS 102226]|uniref:Uncharacterized protein n=1 Tax=Fonsecaea multimorphosa CBS 102226 TaxID=1442371 RepID=A0A0D2KAA2_9EURO|nr:uncharacterized protein Z520_01408 [Fonsecaea multimorphosa CBS 102226]KIY02943.1 hypothetical protein Z520_01408 [Fonsecaea multimorphosa CBS 102226]